MVYLPIIAKIGGVSSSTYKMEKPKSSEQPEQPYLSRFFNQWWSLIIAVFTGVLAVRYILSADFHDWKSLVVAGVMSALCLLCFIRFVIRKIREE